PRNGHPGRPVRPRGTIITVRNGSLAVWVPKTLSPHGTGNTRGSCRRAGLAAERAQRRHRRHAGTSEVCGRYIGGPAASTISPLPALPEFRFGTGGNHGSCRQATGN